MKYTFIEGHLPFFWFAQCAASSRFIILGFMRGLKNLSAIKLKMTVGSWVH